MQFDVDVAISLQVREPRKNQFSRVNKGYELNSISFDFHENKLSISCGGDHRLSKMFSASEKQFPPLYMRAILFVSIARYSYF